MNVVTPRHETVEKVLNTSLLSQRFNTSASNIYPSQAKISKSFRLLDDISDEESSNTLSAEQTNIANNSISDDFDF